MLSMANYGVQPALILHFDALLQFKQCQDKIMIKRDTHVSYVMSNPADEARQYFPEIIAIT